MAGLKRRLEAIRHKLPACDLSKLILKRVWNFVDLHNLDFPLNKRALEYKRILIKTLEGWDWQDNQSLYSPMERFIVYMNFNSKNAINMIFKRINNIINGYESRDDRRFALMDYQRVFKQLHRKPEIILNPGYHLLDSFINNWFDLEIAYLKQSHDNFRPKLDSPNDTFAQSTIMRPRQYAKLRCKLSVDQLALILRTVDEAGLVEARSLNQIYREIVPFLSTQYRVELSPGSMRVKSYHPEERDKAIVIEKLEMMIEKVKST